ncbi:MAG: hypothetical protein ACOVJ8_02750 [Sediminibacterium sp.]
MNKAEEILRTYIDFEDVNSSEPVTLLPLTIIDAMEEYATQCQEDMADDYHNGYLQGITTKTIDTIDFFVATRINGASASMVANSEIDIALLKELDNKIRPHINTK